MTGDEHTHIRETRKFSQVAGLQGTALGPKFLLVGRHISLKQEKRRVVPGRGSENFASQEARAAPDQNILTPGCVATRREVDAQHTYIKMELCWTEQLDLHASDRFHSCSTSTSSTSSFLHISAISIITATMTTTVDLKALNIFTRTPVSQDMIHKLVVTTLQVIPCLDDKNTKVANNGKPLPSLMTFINRLVRYTNVYTGTLMSTLVYLDRLKQKLPRTAQGLPCTRHRIFLSCLILASKFHNDSSPKNVHWAKYTEGLFSLKDVNLMERQLLYLLNWDMRVSNEEMCAQLDKFLTPIREDLIKTTKMRSFLHRQQQAVAAQMQVHEESRLSTPSISRSSSASSTLSLGHAASHSRASSVASSSSRAHYRQDSCSLFESESPLEQCKPQWSTGAIDPRIELAARTEEMELNRMLNNLCRTRAA